MITQKLINLAKDFVYKDIEEYHTPSKFHVDYSIEKGQWLAKKLKADKNIVFLGTLLMDCKLGQAFKEGRLKDHVDISLKKSKQILSADKDITSRESVIVLECVKKHHGSLKFDSLEAEICCNADCYKFASVKGVIGGIANFRQMTVDDIVKLYSAKADEKWQALTLDICKKELEPEYKAIKNLFTSFH